MQVVAYLLLVTNSTYVLDAFGQLQRDRADCENGSDELKNEWGWGGFTTRDIERCQTSARAAALIANVRAALHHARTVAEQLPQTDRWNTFLGYVVAKITRPSPPCLPPDQLASAG